MKKLVIRYSLLLALVLVIAVGISAVNTRQTKAATGLATPTNVKVYNPKLDVMYVKWNAVEGATGYYIYCSTQRDGEYSIIKSVTGNGVVVKGLQEGVRYYFKIKAFNRTGIVSDESKIVSGKGRIFGIDISKHNGIINWATVKDNVDFAILRVGYGDNLASQDDTMWNTNVAACEKYGIPYGVYIYSYATSTAQAQSEADHVLRLIKGHNLTYPVFYDMEDASTVWTSATLKADMAETFCNAIKNAGYSVGIYANTNWFNNYLTDSRFNNWDKWVAQYNSTCTYGGTYMMWQYSSDGSVPGINTRVDMNYMYTGVSSDWRDRPVVDVSRGGTIIDPPTGITTKVLDRTSIKVKWNQVDNSTRYILYRKKLGDASFGRIAVLIKNYFVDNGVYAGEEYIYKVCAYTGVDGKEFFSEFSPEKSAKTYISSPSSVKVAQMPKGLKVTWKGVSNVMGYNIYRKTGDSGKFKFLVRTNVLAFDDYSVSKGVKYVYKVQAIRKTPNGSVVSKNDVEKGGMYGTKRPAKVTASTVSSTRIKISWKPVVGATNYQIYRATSANGYYRMIDSITASKSYYTSMGLKSGTKYYYKVRAVRNNGGQKIKSGYSNVAEGITGK